VVRAFTDSLRSELLHDGLDIRLTMVQLPAVNTPQFDWARNHLPSRLRPVPPIFQPEVAAEAIVRAAETTPRELWVGSSSLLAIVASLFLGNYLDRKLAGFGYSGQLTGEPVAPGQPGNLFAPVPGAVGSHGRFDRQAKRRAISLSQTTVERVILGGIAALAVTAVGLGGRAMLRRLAKTG